MDKDKLVKAIELLYGEINDFVENQDAYNVMLNIVKLAKYAEKEDIVKILKSVINLIEEKCCMDYDVCPCCGMKLSYSSKYEEDTNSYYDRRFYCNECGFERKVD